MPDDIASITLDDFRGRTPEELRELVSALDVRLTELHTGPDGELRELGGQEQEQWDRWFRLREHGQARLRDHDRVMAAFRSGRVIEVAYGNLQGNDRGGSGARAADRARRVIDDRFRSGLLADFAAERTEALLTDPSSGPKDLVARYIECAGDRHYEEAFRKLAISPERGHMLWTPEEQAAYARVEELRTAMSESVGLGAAMVPLTLDPSINLTNAGANNNLRQISRVVRTLTNQWQGATSAGATSEWKAEGVQAADGSPGIATAPIPVFMADTDAIFSYELQQDAVNFMGELQRVLVDAVALFTQAAYATGTGTTQPWGVIPHATQLTQAPTGAFAIAHVYQVQNALPARFSANAQWAGNIAVQNTISQFNTSGVFSFPEMRQSPQMLAGKPWNELSDMTSDMTTAGKQYLLYGDFQQFVIVDRLPNFFEVLPGFGANQRPTGQRHAFLTYRTGSDVVVANGLRVLVKA